MNKTILFIATFFILHISFSQVPVNDEISNAIEITTTSFIDENLRLDLASPGSGPINGCNVSESKTAYYKFIAPFTGAVIGSVSDQDSNNPTGEAFIIFYTAPDLNITSDTELIAPVSPCYFLPSINTGIVSGQAYYVLVRRTQLNALSKVSIELKDTDTPENDLIVNATEITGSNFTDKYIRLHKATASSGLQYGCSTTEKVVYYKFTATEDSNIITSITHEIGYPTQISSSTFIYLYEAPDLNVTSETELATPLDVNCNLGNTKSFDVISGQSYYIMVHRPDEDVYSTFSFEKNVPQSERQALINFYLATGGSSWSLDSNWASSSPVSLWSGVGVENGHVVSLQLGSKRITGEITSDLFNLPFLQTLNLKDNQLEGQLIDLTSLSNLQSLDISKNNYIFSDLEPNFPQNSTIPEFLYSNQNKINEPIAIDDPVIGEDLTLSTITSGTDLIYQWAKTDWPVQTDTYTENINGATSSNYTISNLQNDDIVTYTCFVTSPLIPNLTLEREIIKLRTPVSQAERDALMAIYNSAGGDEWYNYLIFQPIENWNTSAHVDTWTGIETYGNKVVLLNLNWLQLNGQLPDEIGDLIHLKEIRISLSSNLTGEIPSSIGNLTELRMLRMQENGLTGEIPSSIENLINLNRLSLSYNQLTGNIPSNLDNLPSLNWISLEGNQIEGEIPSAIGNLSQLTYLYLNDNQLTGEIPSSMGNLSELDILDLQNNNLSGSIPDSFNNLSSPLSFDVRNNNLSGALPSWTSFDNPETVYFRLSGNYFDFSDLEPLLNNGITYSAIEYSPQNTLDDEEEITSPPGVDITLDVNDINVNRDSEDPSPNNVYQWFKDDTIINGANANTYTIVNAQMNDSGVYHCEITNPLVPDLAIVRADITVTVDDNLGIEDIENEGFKIFPNPANNWLSIKTKSLTNAKAQVFDINGKLLFEKVLASEINVMNINQLAAGMYVISVTTDNKQFTQRFIKE